MLPAFIQPATPADSAAAPPGAATASSATGFDAAIDAALAGEPVHCDEESGADAEHEVVPVEPPMAFGVTACGAERTWLDAALVSPPTPGSVSDDRAGAFDPGNPGLDHAAPSAVPMSAAWQGPNGPPEAGLRHGPGADRRVAPWPPEEMPWSTPPMAWPHGGAPVWTGDPARGTGVSPAQGRVPHAAPEIASHGSRPPIDTAVQGPGAAVAGLRLQTGAADPAAVLASGELVTPFSVRGDDVPAQARIGSDVVPAHSAVQGRESRSTDGRDADHSGARETPTWRIAAAAAGVTPPMEPDGGATSFELPLPPARAEHAPGHGSGDVSGRLAPAPSSASDAIRAMPASGPEPERPAGPDVDRAESLNRIVQSLRVQVRNGISEATVRLRPEHLGEVTIAVRVEGRVVSAVVHAESADVREWLQSQEATMRGTLGDHGLHLDRLHVQRDARQDRRDRPPGDARPARPRRHEPDGPRFEIVV